MYVTYDIFVMFLLIVADMACKIVMTCYHHENNWWLSHEVKSQNQLAWIILYYVIPGTWVLTVLRMCYVAMGSVRESLQEKTKWIRGLEK